MIPSYTTNNNTKTEREREREGERGREGGRGDREKRERENRSGYSVITAVVAFYSQGQKRELNWFTYVPIFECRKHI